MIEVSLASDADQTDWEKYLKRTADCHHAFSWAWRGILSRAFDHQALYLIARDKTQSSGGLLGILPLFSVHSMLFGRALISVPYLNAGGILADSGEAFQALLNKAKELCLEHDAKYLELRHRQAIVGDQSDLEVRSHKVSMLLELKSNPEDLFSSFPPKLRSQIRRPTKSGIYAEVSSLSLADRASLAAFYAVFSEHMRDLGTPVYPKRLFAETMQHFGDTCRVITVWHEKKAIAAGITVGQGSTVEIPWASSLRKYSRMSPNMLLYWEAIKTACTDGYQAFDFGRSSPEAGTYKFKLQWGSNPLPLHWYYHVLKGELPDINPQSTKYSTLVGCWKRLPLPLANTLGPWITKSIP